jgi:ABC transporter substrate binding protein (PQQ-dependent alcohol dehydrogenase system)
MAGVDWGVWASVKAVVQSVLRAGSTEFGPVRDDMLGERLNLDGFKGNPMSVRSWDQQVRQPILLAGGNAVIARAPLEGFLHQTNDLDTLGYDAPETECRLE